MRKALRIRRWTREVPPMLSLAFPIMAGLVSQVLMGLADTLMVGRVGVVPLAAASLVNNIAHLPMVFAFGLLTAIAVLTAQAYGAQAGEDIRELLRHGLLISAGAGLGSTLVLWAALPFLDLLGQPPEVVAASKIYLVLFGASMFPALVAHGCKQFLEALNRPWIPTAILFGGVLLNVLLNWIFIYGHWGAPAWGLEGAGLATVIARLIMMAALLAFVVRASSLRAYVPARWNTRLSAAWVSRLLKLGWPVAVQHFLEITAFVFAALMMGWISATAMAAHQIAVISSTISWVFALGIGIAACIRVGHAWGAGQRRRVRRIGFVGLALAGMVMSCFALLFVLAGPSIARTFVTAQGVAALAVQLLLLAALFQVADGVQVVSISTLRGVSDVTVPAIIAMLAYWVIAVPFGYALAFKAGWGPSGIWTGLATGLGTAAVCLTWRFHWLTRGGLQERWRLTEPAETIS